MSKKPKQPKERDPKSYLFWALQKKCVSVVPPEYKYFQIYGDSPEEFMQCLGNGKFQDLVECRHESAAIDKHFFKSFLKKDYTYKGSINPENAWISFFGNWSPHHRWTSPELREVKEVLEMSLLEDGILATPDDLQLLIVWGEEKGFLTVSKELYWRKTRAKTKVTVDVLKGIGVLNWKGTFEVGEVSIKRFGLVKEPNPAWMRDGEVWRVDNPPHQKLPDLGGRRVTAFHGTFTQNLWPILTHHFKPSSHGAFGPGLYVGPWHKATHYARPGAGTTFRLVIEVEAELGVCPTVTAPRDSPLQCHGPRSKGVDAIYYEGFNNPEWCLRTVKQAKITRFYLMR